MLYSNNNDDCTRLPARHLMVMHVLNIVLQKKKQLIVVIVDNRENTYCGQRTKMACFKYPVLIVAN